MTFYDANLSYDANILYDGPTPAPAAGTGGGVGSFDATLYADQPAIWLKLADATGSGTVQDFSGNGNTGTVAGGVTLGETGPITVMPLDTSALFNGSSGKITTTYNPADNGVAVEAILIGEVTSQTTGQGATLNVWTPTLTAPSLAQLQAPIYGYGSLNAQLRVLTNTSAQVSYLNHNGNCSLQTLGWRDPRRRLF